MLKKIKTQRITEKIVDQIKDGIALGDLKAGDRLPAEREMAEQMGVSRPSLREALQILEHTGYVQIIQGRGTFIKEIGQESLTDPLCALISGYESRYHEVYEFRSAIEVWAAGKAAQRIDEDEINKLREIIAEMKNHVEQGIPLTKLDAEFHLAIAKASHNSVYYHVSSTVFHLVHEVTRLSHENLFLHPEDQQMLFNDHEAIFKAIASHEAEAASHLMQYHLDRVEKKIQLKKSI